MAVSSSVHTTICTSPASPMQTDVSTYNELPIYKNKKRTAPMSNSLSSGKKKPRTVTTKPSSGMLQPCTRSILQPQPTTCTPNNMGALSIESFKESKEEQAERESATHKLFTIMMSVYSLSRLPSYENSIKEFKEIFALTSTMKDVLPAEIYYMELLDENPDNNDTMQHLSELLLENATSPYQDNFVILVGDGKTYEHLMQIKHLYGQELEKLLIFPGDWHTLANYQPVLMKAYYHAGLKEIAMSSGYRGETLNSLERCSHFKRTHNFLIQVWEALYQQMLNAYVNKKSLFSLTDCIGKLVLKNNISSTEILSQVDSILSDEHVNFQSFITERCQEDDTWKFWAHFVFEDCLAYIGLYLAVRNHKWRLRVACLKQMAPLFSAYDRIHYQQLIPHHLADLKKISCKHLKLF